MPMHACPKCGLSEWPSAWMAAEHCDPAPALPVVAVDRLLVVEDVTVLKPATQEA